MKKFMVLVLVASVLVLAGCCSMHHAAKWEYKVVAGPHLPEGSGPEALHEAQQTFLNDLGKDGWVLMSETDGKVFYLMRPMKKQ